MKSELTDEFIECFSELPERVKKTARKNYKLWQQNSSQAWSSRNSTQSSPHIR